MAYIILHTMISLPDGTYRVAGGSIDEGDLSADQLRRLERIGAIGSREDALRLNIPILSHNGTVTDYGTTPDPLLTQGDAPVMPSEERAQLVADLPEPTEQMTGRVSLSQPQPEDMPEPEKKARK